MADMHFCLRCGKTIPMWDKTYKYCGRNQFGDNNEYYPTEEKMEKAAKFFGLAIQPQEIHKKEKYQGLTAEEQLIAGIHPDDEMFRKTLDLRYIEDNYTSLSFTTRPARRLRSSSKAA